jgi:hypothetical protein
VHREANKQYGACLWPIDLQIEKLKAERKALEDRVSQLEQTLKSTQETVEQQEVTLATKVNAE